jgi:hypothetical protein
MLVHHAVVLAAQHDPGGWVVVAGARVVRLQVRGRCAAGAVVNGAALFAVERDDFSAEPGLGRPVAAVAPAGCALGASALVFLTLTLGAPRRRWLPEPVRRADLQHTVSRRLAGAR